MRRFMLSFMFCEYEGESETLTVGTEVVVSTSVEYVAPVLRDLYETA